MAAFADGLPLALGREAQMGADVKHADHCRQEDEERSPLSYACSFADSASSMHEKSSSVPNTASGIVLSKA